MAGKSQLRRIEDKLDWLISQSHLPIEERQPYQEPEPRVPVWARPDHLTDESDESEGETDA